MTRVPGDGTTGEAQLPTPPGAGATDEQSLPVGIELLEYDETGLDEREIERPDQYPDPRLISRVTWINMKGVHDAQAVEDLGHHFGLHPLIIEDILHTGQRPKADDLGEYVFVLLRMLSYVEERDAIEHRQVSLVLGTNYVLSFQDEGVDLFDPIQEQIRNGKGRMRRLGADYLAYVLLDAVVDNYFVVLDRLGDRIELLEEELVADPRPPTMQMIHELKQEIIRLRKSVWPLREVIGRLERGGGSLFQDSTQIYLRDVYDHTVQVMDTVETYRDMLSGMLDIYLSSLSNRMNEIMKVLTIIATLFIPLTFIAGVYGMNFQHMPELAWRWGYPLVWLVMLAIVIVMLGYFRRKRWL